MRIRFKYNDITNIIIRVKGRFKTPIHNSAYFTPLPISFYNSYDQVKEWRFPQLLSLHWFNSMLEVKGTSIYNSVPCLKCKIISRYFYCTLFHFLKTLTSYILNSHPSIERTLIIGRVEPHAFSASAIMFAVH